MMEVGELMHSVIIKTQIDLWAFVKVGHVD